MVTLLMSADYSVPRKRVKHELLALATEKKKLIVASSSNSRSSADTRRQTKRNAIADRPNTSAIDSFWSAHALDGLAACNTLAGRPR